MENKIVAYQVGPNTKISFDIIKLDGWTNQDYLGHTKNTNIPVYTNKYLKTGETKIIMEKNYEKLPAGNYKAIVTQIISKPEKDGKQTKSIELDVKDHTDVNGKFEYITFFLKGYSEPQMEISSKTEQDLIERFKLSSLEDLIGKEVALTSKINDKGYTHYFLYEPKSYVEWKTDVTLPCTIKKVYSKNDEKDIVHIKVDKLGEEVDEFIVFNRDNEFDVKSFEYFMKKANLTQDQIGKDKELNISALFEVTKKKSKYDDNKVYTNKKIKWPKPQLKKRESQW